MFGMRCVALCGGLLVAESSVVWAQVELVGTLKIPGNLVDASGVDGIVGNGTPHNLFGAISAIDFAGSNDRYYLLADRGPLDGASQFQCRFHEAGISVDLSQSEPIAFQLRSTTMLRTEDGHPLVGALDAFDSAVPARGLRFDPEGIRVSPQGSLYISDEYGPFLAEFVLTGRRKQIINTPSMFGIRHPAADPVIEDATNSTGRAANSGWEGLAITPDGEQLLVATQKSMLQDRVLQDSKKLPGTHTRLLQWDRKTGQTRQLVYVLDHELSGISEILAVNNYEFLSLERDGKSGLEARTKCIYHFDIKDATDVSAIESLAGNELPVGVIPVRKTLLIDLLDPCWGFAGEDMPEKWEGIVFGPDLPDGRRMLLVAVDNDYKPTDPTRLACFAIKRDALSAFGWKR